MSHSPSLTRRALLGTAAGASAAALAGCSSSGGSAAGAKSLSLQMFGATQDLIDWLNKTALPKFADANGGAKVEIRQTDWGSSFQKLLTGAASGTMADVTMMGQVQTAALAAKHAFLSLDDYVKDWKDKQNFYPEMYKNGEYDGHQYAIPFIADTRTAVYRGDFLSQAGASVKSLPADWDDYKELATTVKSKVSKVSAAAYWGQDNSVGLMQSFSQLLYQAGGSYFDSSGRSILSSEPGVRALTYMVSFFKAKLSNAGIVYNGSGATPLTQGATAMTLTGYSGKQNAEQYNPKVAKDIVAGRPFSAQVGGTPKTVAWINKFGVSAKSKDPDLAWALLSFLVSKENAAKLDQYLGGLPARTDLGDAKFLKSASKDMVGASQYAGALPQNPSMLEIQQKVNVAVQKAVRQQGDPKGLLTDLDKTIDAINNGQS